MKLLFVDFTTKLDTIHDLDRQGRGGMVSSLFLVTDYLAKRGHTVHVMAGIQQHGITAAGVEWSNACDRSYDVVVGNRTMGQVVIPVIAKGRILWTHDLPHHGCILEPTEARGVHTVFLSKFGAKIWRDYFGRDNIRQFSIIPNAVDRTRFKPGEKDRFHLLFASNPDRGLKRLPLLLDAIRSRVSSSIRMTAYSNMKILHPAEIIDGDLHEPTYKEIHDSDVELHDPLPQAELAKVMSTAGVLVMPSDFPEHCSNIILQALACGMPVVTTRMGSAAEYVRNGINGHLIDYWPQHGMIYTVEFVRRLQDVIADLPHYIGLSSLAAKTRIWTWDQVGQAWERLCQRLC